MIRQIFAGAAILLLFSACQQQQQKPVDDIDRKITELLSKMTLEEKVGQMNQYTGFYDLTGPAPSEGNAKNKYEHIKQGLVGSMLNVRGVENVRKMQQLAVDSSRLGIPMIFGFDVIHGHKTLSPIPLAESASWDLQAIEKSARVAAIEASAEGLNWTFAPMVDVSHDPRWGRVMEGAGEDPFLGSKIAIARVKGFQGDDLSADNTIAACAKHWAGYGFVEGGRDYNTVDVSSTTLYNVIFPPFKAAVEEANVRTFMNAFNIINGVPSTGNSFLLRDVLKGDWDFTGFVVSDWSSGAEMINHGYARDLEQVAELAANAGSDMDMESYAYVLHLVDVVKAGKVKESVVDDAVRRILRVKYELGLFDDPYRYCSEEREKKEIYSPDHLAAALDMAKKSIVLLKNENGLLPLSKTQKKLAIIGTLANDKNSPLGNWRMAGDENTAVSVLEGLEKYNADLKYAEGVKLVTGPEAFATELEINTTDRSKFAEAINLAKQSEVVVMVLGENGLQTGEARSRADLGLPGLQEELLEAVYKVNPNIVLVLMNGRPLTIEWAHNHIPAIVEAWQLGTETGNALAQVLFGDYNPSGKLPMTFPRSSAHIPVYYNHFNTGRPGPKTEVFWPHYMDESYIPLYPFGFGLSYSTFEYSGLEVHEVEPGKFEVTVQVSNVSAVDGEEVVQLYIRDRVASIVRPVKELKGFEKRMIKAGETIAVSFVLTQKELGFYNGEGKFLAEPGDFDLWVGPSSAEGLHTSFELK
ncbi:beta-glucosidase BglX [Mangrovibacterium diazotrophicum]|uniref:beta-glucosidase n=1 Tax=Mangrovibacterium diazotrophicum TaxID=1261403 RepID=A0A419W662_9BACT|nr:beta-glucosidase BglX [Mangrovibacterium diazotrophicum]RKD90936.1 beta-glucosidase [Mangrovibacterium diazotrophicum]